MAKNYDVCVFGGAGHIGLPLSILLASKGMRTLIYDINEHTLETISKGEMPFIEDGAEELLRQVQSKQMLGLSSNIKDLAGIPNLIITIGTPVDEFLNPVTKSFAQCFDKLIPVLSDDQTLILRSTVSPGITDWLGKYLQSKGCNAKIAFCPERVVQGKTIEEIQTLPQIISGLTPEAEANAASLFERIAPTIVRMAPKEAEFAKLFCNVYRYVQFAISNQFYMMATQHGLDYSRILQGMKKDYSRMKDIPGAGFAAGPCLFKDTMQLTASSNNQFSLGYDAMMVNEGLPLFLIEQLRQRYDLSKITVGLLGMAFKADSDDTRSSLSYKLKNSLRIYARETLTTDPYVDTDTELLPLEAVIERSDVLILCVPHQVYKKLDIRGKPVVDVWNFFGKGTQLPPRVLSGLGQHR